MSEAPVDLRQAALAHFIINVLLELQPAERVAVLANVKRNRIFCSVCGYGSQAEPNTNCQCDNDE